MVWLVVLSVDIVLVILLLLSNSSILKLLKESSHVLYQITLIKIAYFYEILGVCMIF